MRVWDGVSDATIEFHADEVFASTPPSSTEQEVLSYMVEISNLQQAMFVYLSEHGKGQVEVRDKTRLQNIETHLPGSQADDLESVADPWPVLSLSGPDESGHLTARLLIGADGPNSPVRKYAGIENYGWQYGRRGVVGTLRCIGSATSSPPDASNYGHTAFQRFLPTGPIAFLPLEDSAGSMVWTLPPQYAQAVEQLHRDTPADAPIQPLAELVSAAFRLPWRQLDALFQRIFAVKEEAKMAAADGSPEEGRNAEWSWLVKAIAESVEEIGGLEALPDHSQGSVPPPVRSVDKRSVASFPLQVKHADAYLGSSLQLSSEGEAPGFKLPSPSRVLTAGLSALGFAPGGAGANAGKGRTALVGDAAHSIHPQAGQGLNLGIADARSLTNTIATAIHSGADLGAHTALKAYPQDRYWENQKMLSAVDHLHWLYASPVPSHLAPRSSFAAAGSQSGVESKYEGPLRALAREGVAKGVLWARSTGLEVVNELGPIKNAFMRQAGGKR